MGGGVGGGDDRETGPWVGTVPAQESTAVANDIWHVTMTDDAAPPQLLIMAQMPAGQCVQSSRAPLTAAWPRW